MSQVLLTGGAGYIGSITLEELQKAGHSVVVLDNLSEGHLAVLPKEVTLYQGDVGDQQLLEKIFTTQKIDCVLHFAGLALVGESVSHPKRYFDNNVLQTLTLLETMVKHQVRRLVFSSSCAIFGEPLQLPLTEDHPKKPLNPYGESKMIVEETLKRAHQTHGLSSCSLRYFNAAGGTEKNGEDRKLETHLIPLALDVALGKRPSLEILGTDYPTPDGTCIRDYIHVLDLARAHILAMDYLNKIPLSYFNLGTGQGHSVQEVLGTARKITGKPIPTLSKPRRPGDTSSLFASPVLAKKELGWEPLYPGLSDIITSAWLWRKAHPKGYEQ